ncbi:hypothetical protein [Methylocapsa palsarum]|uniref:Uncharacterized protein n=1 Tax=Methylocapsa palsarum TaxID=1612308 RepID=A0A1I3VSB5_9HYPH|nr:hypothetical protein [Methylocapsa palsarum]SFJ98060.1 hypothetical protein SAMN05444581_10162 [Methylocapsa palsarum]
MSCKIALLAVALTGAVAMAQAQPFLQPGEPAAVPYPPGVPWGAQASYRPKPACRPMCDNDFSPCDPIYFKTEDGRCAGINLR